MTADSANAPLPSRPARAPDPAPAGATTPSTTHAAQAAPAVPASGAPPEGDAERDARTPAEYTETPGSHRRPSDGAALDVGG